VLEITPLTSEFAIAPQIALVDIETIRDHGYRAILNARPDDEMGEYMRSGEAIRAARDLGLDYAHAPAHNHAMFDPNTIDQFEAALVDLPKPVLAHCKSGTRAAILWALVAARHRNVNDVIATLNKAGQDMEFLEQELLDQAALVRSSPFRLKDAGLLSLGRSLLLGPGAD
jgi:uncharacterized protein (TIGR01244 family)